MKIFRRCKISNVNLEALSLCSGIRDVGGGGHLVCLRIVISFHLDQVSTKITTGIARTKVSNFDGSRAWTVDGYNFARN